MTSDIVTYFLLPDRFLVDFYSSILSFETVYKAVGGFYIPEEIRKFAELMLSTEARASVRMGEHTMLNSAHNFGVYSKSGRRTIFQIDFSYKRISLIERGKISKSYDFNDLEQYDSEENLHIVIRFCNNKTLEFDADTAEEKYTICRLLGIILGSETFDSNGSYGRETGGQSTQLSTIKQIIKEGVLDKKGNTKIPTWSRRRLQVCPGEFSYYKPGDEVALNLVQLWENFTTVGRNGQTGFVVAVRDRSYYFRVTNEKGINVELERDKWIQAFQQARQRKRATFLLLEMSNNAEHANNRQLPMIPIDEDVSYENQNPTPSTVSSGNSTSRSRSTMSSTESDSSRDILEGLQVINELDAVLNDEMASGYPRRCIDPRVVQTTSPSMVAPAHNWVRPPNSSENDAKIQIIEFIPEPDYEPQPPPMHRSNSGSSLGTGMLERDKQSSGIYKQVITIDANSNPQRFDNRESGMYNHVIQNEPQLLRESGEYTKSIIDPQMSRTSGDCTKSIKPSPGAVHVMSNSNEIPKLRKVGSKKTSEIERTSPRETSPHSKLSVKQMQGNFENNTHDTQPVPDKLPSPRDKGKPRRAPGESSPVGRIPPSPPAPPAPPAAPPAPSPSLLPRREVKGKLKQIHWNRTPKPMVMDSIWERPRDMTPLLNISLLEEQFAVKERDATSTQGPKPTQAGKQQMLVDAKRGQILDIFISGLKNEGTRKLIDILNSVSEDDSFPAEKLTTIRRYQPTEDEIDMYRAYAHKKHELHPVDQFMLELCEIPCLSIRIDICLTLWEFPWQFESICQLVDQVHAACGELLNSQMLVLVLEYLLAIGNHLNRNWSENNVTTGFQITSLDKVLSVRGKDTGYTLVHFLVEQLRVSDPGLLQWTESVQMVKKCEQVSVKSVAAESEVLKADLSKVKRHLRTLKSQRVYYSRQDNKFQQDAQNLTVEYEMKLEKLDRQGGEIQNKYRKILTRFGEPLYQKSDELFAVIASFSDKFKYAMKELDTRTIERKHSTS